MTLEQSLKALKSAFSGKSAEVDSLSAQISTLKASNESLSAELGLAVEKLDANAGVVAERDALAAKVDELTKALAESNKIKAEAVSQIETVGKKAAAIVASVGASPVELPVEASTKVAADVWAEYLEIKDPVAKAAFYAKNRPAIIAHLGLK
jgi:predicted RNase H-like nuclease (RuvC/YqgF family)